MTTSIIARVNNVDIMSISDERLVPIKPICEALGIDSEAQLMENSEKCSVCLWNIFSDGLLTINPANVVI